VSGIAVILPAAGRSVRFGGPRSKLLEPLAGEPVIRHSVRAFLSRNDVAMLVIAAPIEDSASLKDALDELANDRRVKFCTGGACRAESVRSALREVSQDIEWVAVHDAARPLVSHDLIDRTLAEAHKHGAAVPALPVTLTIKEADGPLPARVRRTVPRQSLWAMQTPQIMRRTDLLAAFQTCPVPLDQITDDAQVLELAGRTVWLVEGDERNLKITTQADLKVAQLMMQKQSEREQTA
jgi:2-C-methyl-D-erythritol 4-phosphate cytidylyltransferase